MRPKVSIIIGTIVMTLLSSIATAASMVAAEDFTASHSARRPINEVFDPDYSCLFDLYRDKCIPGSEHQCPENFGNNDDSTCFPLDENGDWECSEGYHSIDEDETGQCYSNGTHPFCCSSISSHWILT